MWPYWSFCLKRTWAWMVARDAFIVAMGAGFWCRDLHGPAETYTYSRHISETNTYRYYF